MQFTHILGIDISKHTIDLALSENKANAAMLNYKLDNNLKGYKSLLVWIKKQRIALREVLICLENTGIYHRSLVSYLQSEQAFVWVENPVAIKWSMGLTRGKTDTLDAQRICLYAFRYQDKAKEYSARDQALGKVGELLAARERLIKTRKMLLAPIKELKEAGLKEEEKLVKKACKQTLSALEKEIKTIDKDLKDLVQKEPTLQASYSYIRSVEHVGLITALQLLVYTHSFERFDSAKKLASYAGVAPFAYSSGSSIRGRTRVHPMANKTLKTALHMCAISAIRWKGEMRSYFERKVAEGKNKMSILNAIRNKILQRIYACVKA
ncbi:IS110 family transposase, partial [Rhizobium leguminosarum]|nr:IS110 family transposase [Rhizobium leguminosarum]